MGTIGRAGAIALIAAPIPSLAAEWDTRVTGYLNLGVALGDFDVRRDGLGVFRDGEAHVTAKLVADNGITFGARVELEAFTSIDQIDENYGWISGDFGTLLIGSNDTALNEHGGTGILYVNGYFNYYDGTSTITPGDPGGFMGLDDSIGVRYWYKIGGFEAGVSYQPDALIDAARDTNNPVFSADDQWAFGANYTGTVGEFAFALGGGYLTNQSLEEYRFGVEAAYGGLSLAGFYENEDPDGVADLDVERFGIGAIYAEGPWSVGGGYVRSDFFSNGTEDFFHVGAKYRLAPGVALNGLVQYGEDRFDNDGGLGSIYLEMRF